MNVYELWNTEIAHVVSVLSTYTLDTSSHSSLRRIVEMAQSLVLKACVIK